MPAGPTGSHPLVPNFSFVADASRVTSPLFELQSLSQSPPPPLFLVLMCPLLAIVPPQLRLRLFRRKIFSTVKCLQMQVIYRKMFIFPVFVCVLENAPENILRCLARRKMKKCFLFFLTFLLKT
jgi:hypothetical protein